MHGPHAWCNDIVVVEISYAAAVLHFGFGDGTLLLRATGPGMLEQYAETKVGKPACES